MATISRYLELEKDDFQTETLYRLKKGWTLEFRSGASLFGTRFKILTNHPLSDGDGYRRSEFQTIPWDRSDAGGGHASDPTGYIARLPLKIAGAFQYRYEDSETHAVLGSGYFHVDPDLTFHNGEALSLDGVVLQTVVVKQLGPLSEWRERLQVAVETGYNMLHFTPIQELGDSNSAYALNDQLKIAPTIQGTLADVSKEVQTLYQKHNVLSIVDIVLNHTAHSSPWLKDHPEVTYNLENSPHLRAAFLLDYLIRAFSGEVAAGKWEDRGIPATITQGHHVDKIKHTLWHEIFPRGKLHEYYLADTDKLVEEFRTVSKNYRAYDNRVAGIRELHLHSGPAYRRFGAAVDLEEARAYFKAPTNAEGGDANNDWRINGAADSLRNWLNNENGKRYEAFQSHLAAAINGIAGTLQYERLQGDGPRLGAFTDKWPLVPKYFHVFEDFKSFEDAEAASLDPARCKFIMAHNGWVMTFDPLKNFAADDCNVYLRRELIPWTDNCKLRYGEKPEDCPYLWQRMHDYVVAMAAIFHGVRLDNAHSTPLNVAEYMLDSARAANPNLYVIAELFTGSEGKDNVFVNRLGLSSLIREAESAVDSHDLGRQVHRYGGEPVGAFLPLISSKMRPSVAHALLYDQTHDNPSMIKKHSLADVLPSATAVTMAHVAAGSTRGYDELVPFAIDIVTEKRLYRSFAKRAGEQNQVDLSTGLLAVRRCLNKLHFEMAQKGYSQVFVDQMDSNTMAITRHNPTDHSAYVAVLRNAFHNPPHDAFSHPPALRPLQIEGIIDSIVLEAGLEYTGDVKFEDDAKYITGLKDGFNLYMQENFGVEKSRYLERDAEMQKSQAKRDVRFMYFPPGAVVVFRMSAGSPTDVINKIKTALSDASIGKLEQICQKLTLPDFNRILFRTNEEEADDGKGGGAYHIGHFGSLPYCGLQAFVTVLERLRVHQDLGHPFCANLRSGDWMMDYISNRLRNYESTAELADWFGSVFDHVKGLPRYLVPQYFDLVVTQAYQKIVAVGWSRLGKFVANGSEFTRLAALGTYQMCGIVMSSKLPALSPSLAAPTPPKMKNPASGQEFDGAASLAAGLPHFSVGWTRNWGRDTFIALRGLLLLTEQFQEARYIILAYGACLRHGLIPNLLSEGIGARYNARDAVWWWLYSIQQYMRLAPAGEGILQDVVSRLYPQDDSPPNQPGQADQPLVEVMQEALTKHVQGLTFRERNGGWNLDRDMCSEGFNNGIGVDLATGFVHGGNPHNCGTWMDKMGSSEPAGTRGKPATPRDGSAIELVALSYSTVDWLAEINKDGKYPYDGIKLQNKSGQTKPLTFLDWKRMIKDHFEERFFVGKDSSEEFIRREFVNVVPIYKDTYGAFHSWADYQLRPNLCVAMAVAPEMFDPQHAWSVLAVVEEHLLGPLGLKTLTPRDLQYDGNYDNDDQSTNGKRAHGFNYHQGPEWVWPMGYFLRAKLIFAGKQQNPDVVSTTRAFVERVLGRHWLHLRHSDWKGLPELTNADGAFCAHSCHTQAWSMASILEALYALQQDK